MECGILLHSSFVPWSVCASVCCMSHVWAVQRRPHWSTCRFGCGPELDFGWVHPWVGLVLESVAFLRAGLGWDSTNDDFFGATDGMNSYIFIVILPILPATNYWSTESRIIVSLHGIWIVYDVFTINIYVWFVVPIIILFSIAKCRWWVGLGQVIISVGSVGLGFRKRCGLAWAQATWPHLVRARL